MKLYKLIFFKFFVFGSTETQEVCNFDEWNYEIKEHKCDINEGDFLITDNNHSQVFQFDFADLKNKFENIKIEANFILEKGKRSSEILKSMDYLIDGFEDKIENYYISASIFKYKLDITENSFKKYEIKLKKRCACEQKRKLNFLNAIYQDFLQSKSVFDEKILIFDEFVTSLIHVNRQMNELLNLIKPYPIHLDSLMTIFDEFARCAYSKTFNSTYISDRNLLINFHFRIQQKYQNEISIRKIEPQKESNLDEYSQDLKNIEIILDNFNERMEIIENTVKNLYFIPIPFFKRLLDCRFLKKVFDISQINYHEFYEQMDRVNENCTRNMSIKDLEKEKENIEQKIKEFRSYNLLPKEAFQQLFPNKYVIFENQKKRLEEIEQEKFTNFQKIELMRTVTTFLKEKILFNLGFLEKHHEKMPQYSDFLENSTLILGQNKKFGSIPEENFTEKQIQDLIYKMNDSFID